MSNRWWVETGTFVIFYKGSRILKGINHVGL